MTLHIKGQEPSASKTGLLPNPSAARNPKMRVPKDSHFSLVAGTGLRHNSLNVNCSSSNPGAADNKKWTLMGPFFLSSGDRI